MRQQNKKAMDIDFKANIIRLMQHPIMNKTIDELSNSEQDSAYDLILDLIDSSEDESYTIIDYIQMARLHYVLAELTYALGGDPERIISNFSSSLRNLEKGGFDLSMNKWAELVSLRMTEE